jgi:hydrogenase 3 maturation protease
LTSHLNIDVSKLTNRDIQRIIRQWLKEKPVAEIARDFHKKRDRYQTMTTNILLGIGNTLNGDDGVGIYVAERFRKDNWIPFACGTAPENFTRIIRKTRPSCLVLVDAAAMGISPGEYRIIPRDKIEDVSIGTHQLPLSFLIDFLSGTVERIILIGIQPEHAGTGGEISLPVRKGADRLLDVLSTGEIDCIPVFESK